MASATIKPAGGGDYTTLALWAAAKLALAGTQDAVCYVGDCGSLTIAAWIPSSSTISVDSSAKHNGIDSGTAGLAFAGNISITAGLNWTVQDLYVTTRLRYVLTNSAAVPVVLFQRNLISTASGALIPLEMTRSTNLAMAGPGTYTARNNVVIVANPASATPAMRFLAQTTGISSDVEMLVAVHNNTVITNTTAAGIRCEIDDTANGTVALEVQANNNAVFGFSAACFNIVQTGTTSPLVTQFSTNATSDTSGPDMQATWGGSGNLGSQSAATWFISPVTNTTLKSGSPGINGGTATSGFTDDILGVTRPTGSQWDIGAFESAFGGLGSASLINGMTFVIGD